MRRWLKSLVLLALLTGAAVAAYRYWGREEPTKVTVVPVELRTVQQEVTATGSTQVNRAVQVTAELGTRIVALYFQEGDRVEQGQVLARLDDSELVSQLGQTRHGLDLTERNLAHARDQLERVRRLYDKGFAARQEVEAAERQVDSHRTQLEDQKAALALLNAKRARTSVLAPISGVVTRKFVVEGGIVSDAAGGRAGLGGREGGLVIAEIAELEPLEFHAEVDQADIGKIKIGQAATVRLDAFPDQTFPARPKEIALLASPDPTGRTRYRVRLRLAEPPGRLQVGLTGTVTFVIARRSQVRTVSAPLVLQQGDDEFVFVLEGDRARLRKITTGLRGEDVFEVVSGLEASDVVIDQGRTKLKDGQRVEVLNAKR